MKTKVYCRECEYYRMENEGPLCNIQYSTEIFYNEYINDTTIRKTKIYNPLGLGSNLKGTCKFYKEYVSLWRVLKERCEIILFGQYYDKFFKERK